MHGERSLVYKVDKCRIYVMKWSEIFSDFEIRYKHLNDKLEFQREKLQKGFTSAQAVLDDLKGNTAQMPGEMQSASCK